MLWMIRALELTGRGDSTLAKDLRTEIDNQNAGKFAREE